MREIIVNSIMTPDGTVLKSRNRHDYVKYEDKNGETYMVDGGYDYLRRSNNIVPYTDLSLYDNDDFDLIRNSFDRYDKKTDNYTKVSDMSSEWLINLTNYLRYDISQEDSDFPLWIYLKEVRYRNIDSLLNED